MAKKTSAGLLLFRGAGAAFEVLLVHPGGPLWAKRDDGAWSIPKGEIEEGEAALVAARREVNEELGVEVSVGDGHFVPLGEVKQAGGKRVIAWALRFDFDPGALRSATFEMEWPPRSGRRRAFPEVDRAAWFSLAAAATKILAGQRPFLDALAAAAPRV